MEPLAIDLGFVERMQSYAPNLLAALVILIVGWLVALLVSTVTKGVLSKTHIDNRLVGWLGQSSEKVQVESIISKSVYYLVMLFVLVGFFDALGLTLITEPLNNLLNELFIFMPRIAAGSGLLLLGWLVASVVKTVLAKGLAMSKVDKRLVETTAESGQEAAADSDMSVSKTISETVFWFIMLLFLPAVLNAFALEGVLSPVNNMLDKVLGFLPNVFSAGILLAIGWVVSRVVQKVVSNLLAVSGIDTLAGNIGLNRVLGDLKLSKLAGTICYVFVFIPIIIAALDALALEAVSSPATHMLTMILDAFPLVFAATLIIFFTHAIGLFLGSFTTNILNNIGFNRVFGIIGIQPTQDGDYAPAALVGKLAYLATLFFGLTEAFSILGFDTLNSLLTEVIVLGGQILMGLLILGVGLFVANWAADAIRKAHVPSANLLAPVTQWAIVFLTGAMALRQMGLANEIITLGFGLILGSITLAAAIAFGVGGREVASRKLNEWTHQYEINRELTGSHQ